MSDLSDVKELVKPSLANVSLKNELVGLLSTATSSMTISGLYKECKFTDSEREVARALRELVTEGSVVRNGCGRYEVAIKATALPKAIKAAKFAAVAANPTPPRGIPQAAPVVVASPSISPTMRMLTDADVVSLNDAGVLSIVFTDGLQVVVTHARLQRIAALLSGFSK